MTAAGWLLFAAAANSDVTASAVYDRTEVPLSGWVRVTLTVEGPTKFRIELPDELLDDDSAANWRLRPIGPPVTSDMPGGRERWTQEFRADPYVYREGATVRLGFAPARVFTAANPQSHAVEWPHKEVKVTTALKGDLVEAREPTGIEYLPSPPAPTRPAWEWAVGAVGLFVIGVGLAVLARRLLLRKAPLLPPREWAERELERLTADSAYGAAFAERLSGVLRTFLERRTGLPSTRLTTAELVASASESSIAVGRAVSVLEWSDRVKFAGWRPTDEECATQLADARTAVAEVSADDQPTTG